MTRKCCVLILAVTIAALLLRLPRLSQRPMHGDEAVHAMKFGELLEHGKYIYDPFEYHGPTLNYLTLIPAWLSSCDNLIEVDEFDLRIVPVVCGVFLVLMLLLIADGLGANSAIYAAILTAISPAMVFYSRYYIQEMLLVCFTFAAIVFGYRYYRDRNIIWAILTGVFIGLMHATKETCIITFGSMILAFAVVFLFRKKNYLATENVKQFRILHLIAGLIAAIAISIIFFSSFFTNPHGIIDSILTYKTYFSRADASIIHNHSWSYYLKILLFFKYDNGPIWSEGLIVILAVIGFIAAFTKKAISYVDTNLIRFICFYTLLQTVIYSLIPYKTPWCMLSFLHGMILLAGFGVTFLLQVVPKVLPRIIVIVLLSIAAFHLVFQAYQGNYKYYADSHNPYVYAHPANEIFTAIEKVEYYSQFHPQGKKMYIEVICPEHDYWPLPWYLRAFSSVAYRDNVVFNEPSASLIIAKPSVESDLRKKFYDDSIPFEERHMYLYLFDDPYYIWLRPEIKLEGFVRKDLWDASRQVPDPNDFIKEQSEQ